MMIPWPDRVLPAQWVIPVTMGVWAVLTWVQNQSEARKRERAMMAALYVNPFLSACEDLQSRIYNILELGGIRTLEERYSDGSFAEETLYLIVRYFGWVAAVHRYGPYTQDPVVIRYGEGVRSAFATSYSGRPAGPFNFFTPEQKALGKIVMRRMEGQYGIELDTISCYEFKNRLAFPPLSESESVQQSIEALRNAEYLPGLPNLLGRERLQEAQNHLVDLLNYLEARAGFSLYTGQRKKCARLDGAGAVAGSRRVAASCA